MANLFLHDAKQIELFVRERVTDGVTEMVRDGFQDIEKVKKQMLLERCSQ